MKKMIFTVLILASSYTQASLEEYSNYRFSCYIGNFLHPAYNKDISEDVPPIDRLYFDLNLTNIGSFKYSIRPTSYFTYSDNLFSEKSFLDMHYTEISRSWLLSGDMIIKEFMIGSSKDVYRLEVHLRGEFPGSYSRPNSTIIGTISIYKKLGTGKGKIPTFSCGVSSSTIGASTEIIKDIFGPDF